MSKKILVIDGNSIANRAFYGIRPLTTNSGLHTNAVYGTVNILLKNIEKIAPDYAAVAFDLKSPTFRHKLFAEYKAGRHAMPDELREQFPYIKDACTKLGLAVLSLEGYEADDIIGTVSNFANTDDDLKAYVLTGDRDSLQLITENVSVLLAGNADTTLMDIPAFVDKYGVAPDTFVDIKALMGDSSDNIPGVPGIGEKTALKLISENGSLDKIYGNLNELNVSKGVKDKLESGKDKAYLSQALAKIDLNVPIINTLDDISYTGFDKHGLLELFTELEFGALIKRLGLDSADDIIEAPDVQVQHKVISQSYEEFCNTASNSDFFALTVTDTGENTKLSLTTDGNEVYTTEVDAEKRHDFLCKYSSKAVVYDTKQLYKNTGIDTDTAFKFDIKLAAYVADSTVGKYELDRLALKYLGKTVSETDNDPIVIFELYRVLYKELESTDSLGVLLEIEQPLAGILTSMENTGFKIDTDGLSAFGITLGVAADVIAGNIYTAAGHEFNINSPKQLGEVLFGELGLPCHKKTKTGYSTNAEVLEKLAPYYPMVNDILEYRQIIKLKSTYADALTALADENGRVHTSFNQTVTATGRLSSTEPNLQNIPIRTELGRELRKFFIPENENKVFIDADYSQIELRLLAEIANDENMISAFKSGTDIHTVTASQVFRVPIDEVTPDMRKRAKAVNFGIVYGISDFSLAQDIGVTKKQAGEYIEGYKNTYPGIASYLDNIIKEAYENGYVTTKFGRRRYIPELSASKMMLKKFGERVAMNSPIQGTAADIIKIAMINTYNALKASKIDARLILQVHDELIIEADKSCAEKASEILKREMEAFSDFNVPLTSEVSTGNTWYECK